jgi:hypothetical protein
MFNKYILLSVQKKEEVSGLITPTTESFKIGTVVDYDKQIEAPLFKEAQVYYEGGRNVTLNGEEFILIREDQLVCQK